MRRSGRHRSRRQLSSPRSPRRKGRGSSKINSACQQSTHGPTRIPPAARMRHKEALPARSRPKSRRHKAVLSSPLRASWKSRWHHRAAARIYLPKSCRVSDRPAERSRNWVAARPCARCRPPRNLCGIAAERNGCLACRHDDDGLYGSTTAAPLTSSAPVGSKALLSYKLVAKR